MRIINKVAYLHMGLSEGNMFYTIKIFPSLYEQKVEWILEEKGDMGQSQEGRVIIWKSA